MYFGTKLFESLLTIRRYGYVRIGVSTPDGEWTFGNNNVINDAHPMPCSDSDSKDIAYIRKIFDFIESHPDQYDTSKACCSPS